jgi:hypothetical protein
MDYVIFAIYEKFKLDIVSGVFDKMDKKLNWKIKIKNK